MLKSKAWLSVPLAEIEKLPEPIPIPLPRKIGSTTSDAVLTLSKNARSLETEVAVPLKDRVTPVSVPRAVLKSAKLVDVIPKLKLSLTTAVPLTVKLLTIVPGGLAKTEVDSRAIAAAHKAICVFIDYPP
jgi:hypothetical protein